MPSDEEDAEVTPHRPKAKVPLWIVATAVGVWLSLIAAVGIGAYAFSGPSEQEIQDKHWEYDKLRTQRAWISANAISHTDDAVAQKRFDELPEQSLALERKYAKHWQQRGYKIRP